MSRLFWKILVRVEQGQLLATAILADQSPLLPQSLPENFGEDFSEDFDDTARIAEYQTTVAEIERLTGLDFGDLRNHDTFQPGPEEALSQRTGWRASTTPAWTTRRGISVRAATAKGCGGHPRTRRREDALKRTGGKYVIKSIYTTRFC